MTKNLVMASIVSIAVAVLAAVAARGRTSAPVRDDRPGPSPTGAPTPDVRATPGRPSDPRPAGPAKSDSPAAEESATRTCIRELLSLCADRATADPDKLRKRAARMQELADQLKQDRTVAFEDLKALLAKDENPRVQVVALTLIATLGGPESLGLLVDTARDAARAVHLRAGAVAALADFESVGLQQMPLDASRLLVMNELSADPVPEVRQSVACSLSGTPGASATQILHRLAQDDSEDVVLAVLRGLERVGTPESLVYLSAVHGRHPKLATSATQVAQSICTRLGIQTESR